MVGWRVHCKPRKPTKNNNLFSFFEWRRTLPVCRNKLNIEGGTDIFPEIISQSYFSEKRFPNSFVPNNTKNLFSRGNIRDFILPKKNVSINFGNFLNGLFEQIHLFCPILWEQNQGIFQQIFLRSISGIYVGI